MPNGLSGYVAYPKADLVALLRTLTPEAVVGSKYDIEGYRLTSREYPEEIPITASRLLELLDGWAPDVVPIDEHEFSYFAIRYEGRTMDLSKWVRMGNTSPLFAELQSRRKGFGVIEKRSVQSQIAHAPDPVIYRLSAFDWSLRAGVALVFAVFGLEKLAGTQWNALFDAIGLGRGFQYLTGLFQLGGAALLFVPRAARLGAR